MNCYLFSYGTLQKEKVQLTLFGRRLQGWSDLLAGFITASVEISDETFLSKGEGQQQLTAVKSDDTNDVVKGTAFEITEEELLLCDRYEPAGYERINVALQSGREAWIYVLSE